jgi:hypothetical protein
MTSSYISSKKRYLRIAFAVFLFTIVVAPWFAVFHFGTQFCTSAIFSNRLPCTESYANLLRLFDQPLVGLQFVYVYFGLGFLLPALLFALYCYFWGHIGWKLPLFVGGLVVSKKVFDVAELLWRVDIKNASHAIYVFGTAFLDALYFLLLFILFLLLMYAVVFGRKHDPHHT